MHLKYPQQKQFYTWEELSCLARALGFHHETLEKCIPDEITSREDRISYKDLMRLIALKFFNDALDRSANMHTADYNINSLRKSLELLNHRILSFDELNDVRVAFQVYEAGDMRGMIIEEHTLMRTLKLANRTVAPLKLMHRVKHMQDRLDEPGRLQLYEFLDLIVLCELSDQVEVPDPKKKPLDKTWRKLFQLDEFERVFATYDEKLENYMNQLFVQEERNYGKEKLGSNRIPKESAVETSARKKLVKQQKKKYKELHKSINQSTEEVRRTKAGVIRSRPISAPDVENFRLPSRLSQDERRPLTVADLLTSPHLPSHVPLRPHSAPTGNQSIDSLRLTDPRWKLLQAIHDKKANQQTSQQRRVYAVRSAPQPQISPLYSELSEREQSQPPVLDASLRQGGVRARTRAGTPLVVTERDVAERQRVLDSLQYEIQTLEERTVQRLEEQLDQLLPNFRHRKALKDEEIEKQKLEAEMHAKRKNRKKRLPIQVQKPTDPEVFQRITHPTPRSFFQQHNNNCNARKQDLHLGKVAWTSGRSKIARAPSFSLKPQIQLHLVGGKFGGSGELQDKGTGILDVVSTVSSTDDTNSVAQTTDITKHATASLFGAALRAPSELDPEKYSGSRIGAAAALHDYFSAESDTGADVLESKKSREINKEMMQHSCDMPGESIKNETTEGALLERKVKSEAGLGGWGDNNQDAKLRESRSVGELQNLMRAPSKLLTGRSSDSRRGRWERTTVSRKVTAYDDDELKLHGIPLSEIDKLTLKSEGQSLQDFAVVGGDSYFLR